MSKFKRFGDRIAMCLLGKLYAAAITASRYSIIEYDVAVNDDSSQSSHLVEAATRVQLGV